MMKQEIKLSGEWRYLAFLNWRVDRSQLAPHVPHGTELDLWREEECYLSVVGLRFLNMRVKGLPIPLHQEFSQINLRFYVRRTVPSATGIEIRRGVRFLCELVPGALLALGAKLFINEPFRAAVLHHQIQPLPQEGENPRFVEYSWRKPGHGMLYMDPMGTPEPLPENTLEEFIAERCWGYSPQRDGSTQEYRVEHPRWKIWKARQAGLEGNFASPFGEELSRLLTREPDHAFLAEGSPVAVYMPGNVL